MCQQERVVALFEDIKARIDGAFPDNPLMKGVMVVALAEAFHMETGCTDDYGQALIYTGLTRDENDDWAVFVCPDDDEPDTLPPSVLAQLAHRERN